MHLMCGYLTAADNAAEIVHLLGDNQRIVFTKHSSLFHDMLSGSEWLHSISGLTQLSNRSNLM